VAELFESFTHEALATATIAQVHVAYLKDGGGKVAVKVQCPGSEAGGVLSTSTRLTLNTLLPLLLLLLHAPRMIHPECKSCSDLDSSARSHWPSRQDLMAKDMGNMLQVAEAMVRGCRLPR